MSAPANTPRRICAICGSRKRIEVHHVCKSTNAREATISVCTVCHKELDALLDLYGIDPRPGRRAGSDPPDPATRIWAVVAGMLVALSVWSHALGQGSSENDFADSLDAFARLMTLLDRTFAGGTDAVDYRGRRARGGVEHVHKTDAAVSARSIPRFSQSYLTALATVARELLAGSDRDITFVLALADIAANAGKVSRMLSQLDSRPRAVRPGVAVRPGAIALERMREQDAPRLRKLPLALLALARADLAGVEPQASDVEAVHAYARDSAARMRLFAELAGASGAVDAERILTRYGEAA